MPSPYERREAAKQAAANELSKRWPGAFMPEPGAWRTEIVECVLAAYDAALGAQITDLKEERDELARRLVAERDAHLEQEQQLRAGEAEGDAEERRAAYQQRIRNASVTQADGARAAAGLHIGPSGEHQETSEQQNWHVLAKAWFLKMERAEDEADAERAVLSLAATFGDPATFPPEREAMQALERWRLGSAYDRDLIEHVWSAARARHPHHVEQQAAINEFDARVVVPELQEDLASTRAEVKRLRAALEDCEKCLALSLGEGGGR